MFTPVNRQPMRTLILEHLRKGRSISPVEAAAMWRCRDLPKRISELRKEGHVIRGERRTDSTGQAYHRYILLEPSPSVYRQRQQFQNVIA